MKLADKIFGRDVEGAAERYLRKPQKPKEEQNIPKTVTPDSRGISNKRPGKGQTTPKTTSVKKVNLTDYILLPQHNLYVAKETSYHDENWYGAHKALHQDGARMLTIREFIDFLSLLRSGNVVDGLEQRLPQDESLAIYDKLIEQKQGLVRTEWLDAYFKTVDGARYINYHHKIINGQLQPQNSEPLEECIIDKDRGDVFSVIRNPHVDLFGANRQGLPIREDTSSQFSYRSPLISDSIAWFKTLPYEVVLNCGVGAQPNFPSRPDDSNRLTLGVRAVRSK